MPTDQINALYNSVIGNLSAILATGQIGLMSLLKALEIDLYKKTESLRDPENPLTPLLSQYTTTETLKRLTPAATRLVNQAGANIAKWGTQSVETLGLAMSEETGEVAKAILKWQFEAGNRDNIKLEAIDLGALCLQMMLLFPETSHTSP